jgi:hypothetical protein
MLMAHLSTMEMESGARYLPQNGMTKGKRYRIAKGLREVQQLL